MDRPLPKADHPTRESILLAEDDPALRVLAAKVLRRQGYTVLEASNGAEAIELAEGCGGVLDLLVSDMAMPGMGGHQLARTVTERWPHVRIVLMSGYMAESMSSEGLAGSADAFLEKPFTPASLLALVRNVLASPHGGTVAR